MAWSNFTRNWNVIECNQGLGLETYPATVLTFEGDGSGDTSSKLKTDDGVAWGSYAKHVGGAGTNTDPEIVTLKRGIGEYVIKRKGTRIACYPGEAASVTFEAKLASPKRRPRSNDLPITSGPHGGDPDPQETKPIWEAQEGG